MQKLQYAQALIDAKGKQSIPLGVELVTPLALVSLALCSKWMLAAATGNPYAKLMLNLIHFSGDNTPLDPVGSKTKGDALATRLHFDF